VRVSPSATAANDLHLLAENREVLFVPRSRRCGAQLLAQRSGDEHLRPGSSNGYATTANPEVRKHTRDDVAGESGQQTGSNRPPWGPTQALRNRGRSWEDSGSDTGSRLRLSIDPPPSVTVRCTGRQRLVGSDTEGVTGSNPVAPTTKTLTSGNAGQFAISGRFRGRVLDGERSHA
jgi:hypothetical protein